MSQAVTTLDYPIRGNYYYIIDFRNLRKPKLLPIYFLSKRRAKILLKKYVPILSERNQFSIFRGKKIKSQKIRYKLSAGKDKTLFFGFNGKYDFPSARKWNITQKAYRTLMRRRLRRMGLLTKVPGKVKYNKAPRFAYVENHQKVANCPHTLAQAFQLDRKPEHIYYIILKKWPNRTFFTFDCMRLDIKNRTIKRVKIKGRRTDIIHPYILPEIWNLINKKRGYRKLLQSYQEAKKSLL